MNKNSPFYTISFMCILCIIFGFGIATVNYATIDLLKLNESATRNKSIGIAFQLPVDHPNKEAYAQAVNRYITVDSFKIETKTVHVFHSSYDQSIGFIFSGIGFWDEIQGIIVLSKNLDTIQNIQFLKQSETPGLGARIEETMFTDQFKKIVIAWDNEVSSRIIIGSSPNRSLQNRVDGITGATQTSQALMVMINKNLEIFKKAYSLKG